MATHDVDMPPQPCGGCTLCCKVMGVKEISKPQNTWCAMCEIGKGCKSYDVRPPSCIDFECAYAKGMMGARIEMRPDNSKVVMSFTTDGAYPVAHVDTSRPNAWREGPVGEWFNFMVGNLGQGYVSIGDKRIGVTPRKEQRL